MDCQRAEAHLRLLAEEELRRPAWERRIRWAAELLVAIGALDEQVGGRIVADLDLALVARQAFLPPAGRVRPVHGSCRPPRTASVACEQPDAHCAIAPASRARPR